MPKVQITKADVQAFTNASDEIVQSLITGTIARAALFAPCINSEGFDESKAAAAKDILVAVIVRAAEAGAGVVSSLTAGPFAQATDTSQPRRRRFELDEIRELKALCDIRSGGAFTVALTYDANDAFIEDVTQ